MGVYLSEPNTNKDVKEGSGKGLVFCKAEMQGWRKNMEDAAIHEVDLGDGNSLFGVFDGHGGHEVSKYVEERYINILTKLDQYKSKNYAAALDESFRLMDEMLLTPAATRELNEHRGMPEQEPISKTTGCTANVIIVTPKQYIIANAGDSRSSLCRGGRAIDLSYDHKPESIEEQSRIKKAGGTIYMGRVNGGLNLTRSFGDFDYKQRKDLGYEQQMITCKPDVKTVDRQSSDEFIILGCDGIWERYVENSQGLIDIIKRNIQNAKNNRVIMEELLDELVAKDTTSGLGCDNMTAILVKIQ